MHLWGQLLGSSTMGYSTCLRMIIVDITSNYWVCYGHVAFTFESLDIHFVCVWTFTVIARVEWLTLSKTHYTLCLESLLDKTINVYDCLTGACKYHFCISFLAELPCKRSFLRVLESKSNNTSFYDFCYPRKENTQCLIHPERTKDALV